MALKLSDKEVSALAKKLAEKKQKENSQKTVQLAKAKLPEAKKLLSVLNTIPDSVLGFLYTNRYNRGSVTAERIARVLIGKEDGNSDNVDQRSLEADVVLAAHDCTTMAALCKKLGI